MNSLALFTHEVGELVRGKCRYCGAKISIQYPLVELANGILYVLVVAICGLNPDSILWCVLTSIMIVIAVTDLKTMKFPTVCEIFDDCRWGSSFILSCVTVAVLHRRRFVYGSIFTCVRTSV
mgnify:CR=1 FL=1